MTLPSQNRRVQPAAGILATDLGDEMVLLDPDTGMMFGLNGTGRLMWTHLERCTVGELATRLAESFDVEPTRAAADVDALLGELLARGLARELTE
ncbi:MAG TPA: PqqD family protein [Gemmatimonadaceae bacterium]|nr:PqqD family protein [Gemmatimonadaceae bacterium]